MLAMVWGLLRLPGDSFQVNMGALEKNTTTKVADYLYPMPLLYSYLKIQVFIVTAYQKNIFMPQLDTRIKKTAHEERLRVLLVIFVLNAFLFVERIHTPQ